MNPEEIIKKLEALITSAGDFAAEVGIYHERAGFTVEIASDVYAVETRPTLVEAMAEAIKKFEERTAANE